MARPWRIQFPGAVYHVTARGNRKQDIFFDDADRLDFLRILGHAAARFDLRIHAFCLMTNHYHLFLHTPAPNLSTALHWLNATYSIRLNLRRHLSGHLLQGRFKAALVTDNAHWHKLSLYIHLNPVRAGLVEDPADYEWSSCRDYLQAGKPPRHPWLDPAPILAAYGKDKAAVRRYRSALAGALDESPQDWREFQREMAEAARAELDRRAQTHPPAGNPREVPQFAKWRRQPLDLSSELTRCARALNLNPAELRIRRRKFPPRLAVIHHLVENKHVSITAVARFFDLTPSGVSRSLTRCRQALAANPDLAHALQLLSH